MTKLTEGKRNAIAALMSEYDNSTIEDIQNALKDLLGNTLQNMLEAEMNEHLGYHKYQRSSASNARNDTKQKKLRSSLGEHELDVPQDREGSFEPKVVKKRQKDISGIEQKIISMNKKGMTTRQISE